MPPEGIYLPPGVDFERADAEENPRVMVVNETGLPDNTVIEAIEDQFVESASMAWGHGTTFQTYAAQGSLLARSEFKVPASIIEEIRLARDLAERDDDVAAALGWLIAAAYEGGMQNQHQDEKTKGLFDAVARDMKLDAAFAEMYREWLIASQLNTVMLFTRTNLDWQAFGDDDIKSESVAVPRVGVLPAENIRILGNDIFGTGELCYDPDSPSLRRWLDEYFDPNTSAGRKAEMGRNDRVSAAMFTGYREIDYFSSDVEDLPSHSARLYTLNPRMVHRTTMPKGAWKYPRPLLTRDFALLEAKRLLNIMDYALLQGGSNYVVVAKKGSDERPALPEEVENLKGVVARASKTGVIVGDHRLSFEILTPNLEGLLNPAKRRLIGRKLAMALMRVPEHGTEEPGGEGMKAELQIMARVVSHDRTAIKRHVESNVYEETRRRNSQVFIKGTPGIWHPKIILESTQFFTDLVLKLRDRGDIPRRYAVEAAGYNFESAIEDRRREVDNDIDELMMPAAVPFTDPEIGPQDNQEGRPSGSQDGRPTNDPAAPRRRITQNPGETQRAFTEPIHRYFDTELDRTVRIGTLTESLLEEYSEYEPGRMRAIEQEALDSGQVITRSGSACIPVNPGYVTSNERAFKLRDGLRVVIGERQGDKAWVAKVISTREPEFDMATAEDMVARWGFPIPATPTEEEVAAEERERAAGQPVINLEIHQGGGGRVRKVIQRDDDDKIVGSIEMPVEDD